MFFFWKRKRNNRRFSKVKREKEKYGRLNFILAIVFLMVGAVIARLVSLQVMQYDLYMALATGQHQVNSQIEPSRGRIFIRDAQEGSGKLYPLATNKDFAHVYAVPTKIKDPLYASEQLYEIFDKTALEEGVLENLRKMNFFIPCSTALRAVPLL
jgi:cell division protein FtsI/penicillin-binding protein 2